MKIQVAKFKAPGAGALLIELRPCNLKLVACGLPWTGSFRLLREETTGQEHYPKENMNEVIHLTQFKRTDVPHSAIGGIAQDKLSQESESQIDDAEY